MRLGLKLRRLWLGCLLMAPPPLAAHAAETLRFCADPDNLPFSRAEGPERGLYIELAELLAQRLNARAEFVWWHTEYVQRALRNTLFADRCDAFIGLPSDPGFMGRRLLRTRPFLDLGYVLVSRPELAYSTWEDLKQRRLAVQYGTQPQLFLAVRGGFEVTTFRHAEEAIDALARGEVDAAFVWGPSAGYRVSRRYKGSFILVPVAGEGMQWRATVAVNKGNEKLHGDLDQALLALEREIGKLVERYGFPTGAPRNLERAASEQVKETDEARARRSPPANPFRGDAGAIASGRRMFNEHCSHCHAPNAMSPEQSRDLRRMRIRYTDRATVVIYSTMKTGRADRGMPPWTEVLSEEEIWKVVTFLESVQRQPD